MQRPITTIAIALGVACIGSATVAAQQPPLEQHTFSLPDGFAVTAVVAHSPAELARAQLQVLRQEGGRHVGVGPQTVISVAVDESAGLAATTHTQPVGRVQVLSPSMVQLLSPSTSVAGVRRP